MTTYTPSHLSRLLDRLTNVRPQGSGYLGCCPGHDDANPSLSITMTPDNHVRLRCHSAGCSQAAILQALELTPDDLSPDPDDELIVHSDSETITVPAGIEPENPINFDLRHRVYSAVLTFLTLIATHLSDLRRRGLNDNQIQLRMYRSWSPDDRGRLISNLLTQFNLDELAQVPGFILNADGNLSIVWISSGLLVPVRNANGLIVAMKIRRDDTSDGRGKFMSLSGGVGGTSCGAPTHVPFGLRCPLDMVRITEGELKADIATDRGAVPTLGIAGVSSWRHSLPVLEALQTNAVRLAFDADYATKTGVASNLASFAQELISCGYAVSIERWPIENGKGIDDLLVAGHRPELLTGPQATEFLATLDLPEDVEARVADVPAPSALAMQTSCVADPAEEDNASAQSGTVLPFPVDVFPASVRRFAVQVAQSVGCPVDIVAALMLAVIATAIGASRALQIKEGWFESPRIYVAVVAPPGSGKSPAEGLVCRPLHDLQAQFRLEYSQAREAYDEAAESRGPQGRRRARSVPAAAESSSTSPDVAAGIAQDEGTRESPSPLPPEPVLRRLIVSDATTESLAPIMNENPRQLLMIKDELSGWVAGMDQYRAGRGADRQVFLSVWSGSPAIIDRKTQGAPIFVPHPFLNVMGGIQPDMLPELCHAKDRADGFLDRILFSYPDQLGTNHWVSQGVDREAQASWADTLRLLLSLEMRHCNERGIDLPQVVRFTDAAQTRWVEWHDANADEIGSPGLASVLKGHWLKMKSYCARLALTIHMLRVICAETTDENVDLDSLSRAIRLVDYFKSHARKVHGQMHRDTDDRDVEQVVAWIRNHGGECAARDLQRANVAKIKKVSQATQMFKNLIDRGLGRLEVRRAENGHKVNFLVLSE